MIHCKRWLALVFAMLLSLACLCACAPQGGAPSASQADSAGFIPSGKVPSDLRATLTLATWDNQLLVLYDELDLEGRFQQHYPNVNIKIEQAKDDSEYWRSMEIRASANQLPDVMYNKPFTLARFERYMLDLSEPMAEEIAQNTLALDYAFDGRVLGLPEKAVGDYVFFWEDMFQQAGVDVPTTWSSFVDAGKKLQAYYGASIPDFTALSMGAKDEWPTYPFMEYMPILESKNGQFWNEMAGQDTPFSEGTDIYMAYQKAYDLFSSGVCGSDPLDIGHDKSVDNFANKKAAMIVAGSWCLSSIVETVPSVEGLSAFYLPVREASDEPFHTILQGDNFMGVTNQCAHPELALDFVRFYFSADWYPDYIHGVTDQSTMIGFAKEVDPVLAMADQRQPDVLPIMYDGGGAVFQTIAQKARFDYKRLGTHMFVPGFHFQEEMEQLNAAWKIGRDNTVG